MSSLSSLPSLPTPIVLQKPVPAAEIDKQFHLRKGTTRRAIDSKRLLGCIRQGRGGLQAWVFPTDAHAWFLEGLPTDSKGVA